MNHDLFKRSTPETAYALGILYTDGYIRFRKGSWEISLALTDYEVVKWLHDLWDSHRKLDVRLKTKKDGGHYKPLYRTIVTSRKMGEDLLKLGVHPQKSRVNSELPSSPLDFWDFVRGLIDGDGGLYIDRRSRRLRVTFCNNWDPVTIRLAQLFEERGLKCTVTLKKDAKHISNIAVQGPYAEKLCQMMYRNNDSPAILRKRATWERYQRERREYGGLVLENLTYGKVRDFIEELGTLPDTKLARKLKLSPSAVTQYRQKLGIPSFEKPKLVLPSTRDWHRFVGSIPDKVLAEKYDLSPSSISIFRRKTGAPKFRVPSTRI